MAHDEDDDDLYDEEFDFVDDDDDDDEDESDDEADDADDRDEDLGDDEEESSGGGDEFGAGIMDDRPPARNERPERKPRTEKREPRETREPREERQPREARSESRDEPRNDRGSRDERDARDEFGPDAAEGGEDEGEEKVNEDEYGRTEPLANYVVHLYENRQFTRTIERPFTPEDAEAFATEFNRTAKNYSRFAVTSKNDAKPKKVLD